MTGSEARRGVGCLILMLVGHVLLGLVLMCVATLPVTPTVWALCLAVLWPLGSFWVVAAIMVFREASRGTAPRRFRAAGVFMTAVGACFLTVPTGMVVEMWSATGAAWPVPGAVPAGPPVAAGAGRLTMAPPRQVTSIVADAGTGLVAVTGLVGVGSATERVFVGDSNADAPSGLQRVRSSGTPGVLLGWTGDSPSLLYAMEEGLAEGRSYGIAEVAAGSDRVSAWRPVDCTIKKGLALGPDMLLVEEGPGGRSSPRAGGQPGGVRTPHASDALLLVLQEGEWRRRPLALPGALREPSVLWARRLADGLEAILECEEVSEGHVRPAGMVVEGCRPSSVARMAVRDWAVVGWTELLPAEDRCRRFSVAGDGSRLCVLARDADGANVCVTYDLADGGAEVSVARVPDRASGLVCSPDGSRVALTGPVLGREGCRLWVLQVADGTVRRCPLPGSDGWVTAVAWLSAETLAVGVQEDGLAELNASTGEWRDLVRVPEEATPAAVRR
jgi:hypothetical protein